MKRRGRVQWKPDAVREPERRLHPYYSGKELTPEEHDALSPHLVPGAMWMVTEDMSEETHFRDPSMPRHEVPYLLTSVWAPLYSNMKTTAPRGTTVVYMGTVRVEEHTRSAESIRVPRHCFLVGGSRFLVVDLTGLVPVSL